MPAQQKAVFVVGNFHRQFFMDNLHDFLKHKYFAKPDKKYTMEQTASDVLNFLNADKKNYFDVTGFAKDFYLAAFLTQDEKKIFYNKLKAKDFFKQLNAFLYSDNFSICSWTIYMIGKFSNNENASYLEKAYETYFHLTNPMLSYRCLNELSWLISKKTDHYLSDLELDNSITSKLILLYYWETSSDNSKFNQLLTDKELLNFIIPIQILVDSTQEISDRLFGFENYISELYNSTEKSNIDKMEFESIAENYFKTFIKISDTKVDKAHQEFLKRLGED